MIAIEKRLYTVGEAAELCRISVPQMYRLISSGHVRAVRMSAPTSTKPTYRLSCEEIDRLLNEGVKAPIDDSQN
jgi:excisionase family DNA binding protein